MACVVIPIGFGLGQQGIGNAGGNNEALRQLAFKRVQALIAAWYSPEGAPGLACQGVPQPLQHVGKATFVFITLAAKQLTVNLAGDKKDLAHAILVGQTAHQVQILLVQELPRRADHENHITIVQFLHGALFTGTNRVIHAGGIDYIHAF